MTTSFHVTAETRNEIIEADVEVDYKIDRETSECDPVGAYRWYEITITDKVTGLSETHDEMPDDLINIAVEEADSQFPL